MVSPWPDCRVGLASTREQDHQYDRWDARRACGRMGMTTMTMALGIDFGTSHVAATLVDLEQRLALQTTSVPISAKQPHANPLASEHNIDVYLGAASQAVEQLSATKRAQVAVMGVSGQMHGVVLWDSQSLRPSPFYSWQERRAEEDGFLNFARSETRQPRLQAGYGAVTLGWLAAHESRILNGFDQASTLPDYVVVRLCETQQAVMDPVMAHSWGLYDLSKRDWLRAEFARLGVPPSILPALASSGSQAGTLSADRARAWGISHQVPVAVATGDNPASLYATLTQPETDVALTLGTAGQLAVILPADFDPGTEETEGDVEYRPYVDDRLIAVASSLQGGESMAWLVDMLGGWLRELGFDPPSEAELFRLVNRLGLEAINMHPPPHPLTVVPSFIGERHDPMRRGSIGSITPDNFTIGNFSLCLARGIVDNLRTMMPAALLAHRRRLVCSGNGIRRSMLMRQLLMQSFSLPLVVPIFSEEAAVGAALLAGDRLLLNR